MLHQVEAPVEQLLVGMAGVVLDKGEYHACCCGSIPLLQLCEVASAKPHPAYLGSVWGVWTHLKAQVLASLAYPVVLIASCFRDAVSGTLMAC